MKMNKLFSMIAVGLLAMVAKAADVAAVYEVRAWQGNSISGTAITEPVSSLDNPLVGGKEVRFVIRLLSTDYKDVTGYESKKPWALHYVGSYSDDVAWAVNRPKIALAMGNGIIREAEVEDYEINGTYKIYTDIICKYVVQPGDLALPVRFALTNSGTKINLINGFNGTAGWQITNGEVGPDLAALIFNPNVDYRYAPQPESLAPNKSNTDLSISGFYVRTVDFRDRENEENSWYDKSANIWRAVHAGSNSPAPSSPAIQVTGTPKLSSTVYVWSDDDAIVDLPEGVPMDMPAKDGKSTITRKVHTITIEADKIDYRFPISAPADKEGESTVLYLSENPGFVTTSAGLTEQSYLTIPVAVIKKLEPNITVTATDANIIVPAGNDQTVAATELTVEIASGYTGDGFDVTVTPSLYDTDASDPWSKYVRISEQNGGAAWTTQTAWTKHFANTGDPNTDIVNGAKITLYVYALGADNHTAAGEHQILFTPSVEGDGGYFKTMNPSTMHLKYEKPVLTVPPTTSAVGNVDYAFDLTVSDNYKNLNDSDGYTIEYKKKASDSAWKAFDETWRPDATGVLKKVDGDGKLTDERPSLKYNSGTYETSFRVKLGSDASIVSEPAITTVTVSESARATVLVSLDKGKTYIDSLVEVDEGANVMVKVGLSVAYEGATDVCYAFLKPVDDTTKASATGKAIIGNTTGTQGMKISRDDFESQASTITLTDGVADGTELRFEVVLCTEMEYDDDDDKQVPGYQSKDLRITSMNVIPTITKITMGNRNTFVTKSGESMHNNRGDLISAPMGVNREFSFEIDEPSTVDRTAVDTDDKKDGFRVEYEIVEFDGTTKDATEIIGNPSEAKFTYAFTSAGEATVTVRLLDKDMRDPDGTMRWGEEFVFYVDVSDHPYVALTDENGEEFSNKLFYENMTGSKNQSAHMFVKLSETASKDLDIKLTVTCENSEVDPYKCFKLGGGGLAWNEEEKYYTLTIKANQPRTEIWLQEADGTKITSETGFSIKAEVTTDTDVPTAPGTKWKDYFTSTTSYATVENCKPEIVFSAMPCAENDVTNAFVVAVGTKCEFKYTLSDVSQDTTTDNPLTVSWTVGGNSQTETATGPDEKNTYTFTPKFANPGIQSVQVTVTDKDNYNGTGFVSHQWFFDVQASKKLTTLAHGPASGFSTSALSQKYNTAAGIGKGHVWANGIFAGASGFKLDWNMGVSASAYISAAGYKCGDEDNGNLGLYDESIDEYGSKTVDGTPTAYYTYDPADKKDSYLYAWLKTTTGEGNGASSVIYGGFAPEVAGEPMTQSPVALPDQKNGDNLGYEDTIMEAIFSKEYREADNCGDINQDGIPDRKVVEYNLASAGEGEGVNDLRDMSADNDDADFLPAMSAGGYAIVPNTSNNWEKLERAFNAFLEIRGFGVGLNARYPNADENKTIPDRDFTIWEEMAFRTYFNEQGHPGLEQSVPVSKKNDQDKEEFKELADLDDDQKAKLTAFWASTDCKWTPENPTNPTEADTDKDGLPDGYEYWFWYGATVGYPDNNGVWQKPMTGKRFVEADIDKPEEIKSVDIANAFNPTVTGSSEGNAATRGTLAGRDFDNDGISDIEEFLIGTNPVQCDTDGDGMIDGWEIMNGLNPLDPREINPSQDPNNDGDFMAYSNLRVNTNDTAMPREPTLFIERKNELGLYDIYITNDKDFYDAWVAYWWNSVTKTVGDDVARDPQKCGWYLPIVLEEPDPLPAAPTKFYGAKIATVTTPIEDINKLRETLGASLFKLGDEYLPAPDLTLAGATHKITEADCDNMRVIVNAADNFAVIHDQVYDYFGGFDPRTGWGGPCENTAPYNTIYEYRLFKYRQNYGGFDGRPTTMLGRMLANTTNPSKPYSVQYAGTETTHANSNHGADTDGDGLPDGWELYLRKVAGLDPITNQDVANTPDGDGDKLNTVLEFAGTTSTLVYEDCPSIMANFDSVWPNKFYPTNPASSDTDGDGITDWQEGNSWEGIFYDGRVNYRTEQRFTFNYDGSIDKRKGFARFETCYRGGGLNPNSFDTDGDGLPDLWEWQFAGFVVNGEGNPVSGPAVYTDKLKAADGTLNGITPIIDTPDPDRNSRNGNGHFIAGGMDGTYSFDAYTYMDMAELMDYRTGTYRDFDFDGDGLQNYQEYLVQAVRSFRYDDSETPLNGRIVKWPVINPFSLEEPDPITVSERVSAYTYPSFDYTSETNFYALAIKENPAMAALYAEGALDPNDWDWAATGYFAPPPRTWDPNASMLYMQPPSPVYEVTFFGAARLPAIVYASTDPRQWDSDVDGMDDYWELYHGLNPLYGGESGRDIISESLGEIKVTNAEGETKTIIINAKENAWTRFGEIEANYDFDRYPWLAGAPDADPDNDKIRNFEEAITGNMTSPTTSHTDPTPLWMTEPSAPLSVTRLSYAYYSEKLPWAIVGESQDTGRDYMFTFEGNEGYDTDNDWTADSRELTAGIIAATDPLVTSDPYRRAAIYLGGEDNKGVAYQRTGTYINPHSEKLNTDAAYDMFRQFTVECWVKPEAEGTILERGAVYTPATAGAEQGTEQWRANFRLELKEGKFVGSFDDSAAVPSGTPGAGCIVVSRESAKLGEWTHLALSYDGKELRLYVNGEQEAYAQSSLIPANGIVPILQDPASSADYPAADFTVAPGSFVIGARHIKYPITFHPELETTYPATIDEVGALTDFFKGYVAEVRIWDGARTEAEINSEKGKAYTLSDVEENRTKVFEAWSNEARRNDNANVMGTAAIPPQLMMHYDFTSLPGATKEEDVALVPGAFNVKGAFAPDNTVDDNLLAPSWWVDQTTLKCKSTVYTDATVLPWIENTVAHLSAMDGSFADSIYWADARAAYVPSNTSGFDSFKIPNSANPYGWATYENDNDNRRFKVLRYEEMHPEYEGLYLKRRFDNRSRMVGVTDLLPLGGAFAKRESDYWDGQGAMTAWTLTGIDSNGDGVPDWYMGNPADYMRDLVAGLLPGSTVPDPAFRDIADFNGNGLPDWWEQIYGISGKNGHEDSDKDGLSNYVEYLLNEVYMIPGKSFDPINPKTNGYVPDAYVKLGKLYIGDVFTDHDHMADTWEVQWKNLSAVSPYIYDANKDPDGDGWSNYAEFQADTDPTKNASLAIDGIEVAQYPVPIVEASITYLGEQNVNCPIVVQAWNCADEKSRTFQSIPDAKWTIGEVNTGDDRQTTSNTNVMAKTKFLGMNPSKEIMTHLSPGSVVAGSFKIEFKDPNWLVVDLMSGQSYSHGAESADWESLVHDSMRNDNSGKGDLVYELNGEVLGEIDYATGEVVVDFSKLPEYAIFTGDLADPTSATIGATIVSVYTFAQSYTRIAWSSKPVSAGRTSTYYLGDADPRSESNNSVGHLKEGKNNFIVFADTIDANGKYDPGEPFGVAYNVDVGWNYGKFAIELTDTNPVFARYQLTTGMTDRQVVRSDTGDVIESEASGAAVDPTTHWTRIYMQGFKMNGQTTATEVNINGYKVMDKVIDYSDAGRNYIHEGDILDPDNGIYDIGWGMIPEGSSDNDVAEVVFGVVLGNVAIEEGANAKNKVTMSSLLDVSNALVQAQCIVRRYDSFTDRKVPTPIAPGGTSDGVVYSPRPTFKWTDNGYNTYTAFQISVEGDDFSWKSGIQLMPARGADGYYCWTAPICVGDSTIDGEEFKNDKTYKWKITSYNAKFRSDKWSNAVSFKMNVPEDQLDYGTIEVAVKYFGHTVVLDEGTVRVEAFDTPDFSGLSASAGYVKTADKSSVSNSTTAPVKNASIIGLTEGSYYVMAYIDTNNNGKRDNWESWGYACVRDQRDGIIYTPKSIKVGPKVGTHNLVTVYIDDCDTDQDGLPDAWEWTQSKNLSTKGATELAPRTAGSYVSMKSLVGELTTNENPVSKGLATLMSVSLGNANLLAAMMNLDVGEGEDPNDAIIKATTDAKIAEHSLSIANFVVEDGKAKFKVVADVESAAADSELAVFYTFPAVENLTVEYRILKYTSLAAKPIVAKEGTITLGKTEAVIEMPLEDEDATGAMYQIKVSQK